MAAWKTDLEGGVFLSRRYMLIANPWVGLAANGPQTCYLTRGGISMSGNNT